MVGYTSVTVTTGGKLSVAMDLTTMKPQSSVVAWALAHQVRPDLLPLLLIIILFCRFHNLPSHSVWSGYSGYLCKKS